MIFHSMLGTLPQTGRGDDWESLSFLTKIPEFLALFPRRPIDRRFALRGGTRGNQCGGPYPKWGGVAKIDFYVGLTGGG